ncbi:DUF1254 domain-containing protein [Thalassotalea sp. HSM 43]|uniref:DUF1254 domain-containing protein n=1 Tax=Thalassotalea sp. HSM 43 TaxID=2552945 RepID=UPI0010814399|nr:DUF1254 domain-containing protein [Thalassotalea sp. HSM 43]QBY02906.1 DUF1254 domain-containing protein [Thalassotalea sp. HSM 43]
MKKLVLATAISLSFLTVPAMAATTATSLDNFFTKDGVVVDENNYPVMETSRQMLKNQDLVGVNNLLHKRELTPTDKQPVVRMNRDTYYSMALVDVSKGATITLPEIPDGKYMSLEVVTEDHRVQAMKYGAGTYNLTTHSGEHVYLIVRLDATFTKDEVRKYQDQISISANSNNKFDAVAVDKASFDKTEDALKAQAPLMLKENPLDATFGMFTDPRDDSKEMFTKQKYAVGAAVGWGGAQLRDNIYELSPNFADDKCYQMTFEDPQNDAFWSITVYDQKGFMFKDLANISSNTATANEDGTYTVSFGCGADAPNNLEIDNPTGKFNMAARHYIPSKKVRDEGYRLLPFFKEVK